MKITKSILTKIIKEEILKEMVDEKRFQQLRYFFGDAGVRKIQPLENLTNAEIDYIMTAIGNAPTIRKELKSKRGPFPMAVNIVIEAAFEDFVAEKGLNKDPDFKRLLTRNNWGYDPVSGQLAIRTRLYEQIKENGLLPELEKKMTDYFKIYTNGYNEEDFSDPYGYSEEDLVNLYGKPEEDFEDEKDPEPMKIEAIPFDIA